MANQYEEVFLLSECNKKKAIYQGKEGYVQIDVHTLQETGEIKIISEPIITNSSITKCDRNGFEITYPTYLLDAFKQLRGQKYKVLTYILEHKNADNTLIITNRELANKCGVSLKTAQDCIRLLREKGLIATRTGAIMVLPKIAHRGTARREQLLMHKFQEFSD